MADTSVTLGPLTLKNPVMVGSTSLTNSPSKIKALIDAGAGAIVTKTISPFPLSDVPQRFTTGRSGRSLAVTGDPRVGLEDGCAMIRELSAYSDVPIIANVIGRATDADVWVPTCLALQEAGAAMIEVDLNCHPEGGERFGLAESLSFLGALSIGQDPDATRTVVRDLVDALDIPVISKLTLRAPDMLAIARASEEAGATAISGVNTLHSVADVTLDAQGRPCVPGHDTYSLAAVCGPDLAILGRKWTAMVTRYVSTPYISGSGILTVEDAIERMLLGAHSVALASSVYLRGPRIIGETVAGMERFLREQGAGSWDDLRGAGSRWLVAARGESDRTPVVARVVDEAAWAEAGEEVYQSTSLECCVGRSGDGTVFLDESRCTGCGLVLLNAPAGSVEMVEP